MGQDVQNCVSDTQLMELSKLYLDTDLLKVSSIHLYHGKPGKPTLTSTTAKGRLSEGQGEADKCTVLRDVGIQGSSRDLGSRDL